MSSPLQLDIRKVIGGKNPALLKVLPGTLIRMVERIVHVRWLNKALRVLQNDQGVVFARNALRHFGVTVEAVGEENLTTAERPLVVANHPLGGMDGMALIDVVGRHFGLVVLPVNDLLMNIAPLKSVFVPINKHGSNREYRRAFDKAFQDADAVVHFPAGLCSRRKGNRIRDLDWQKSFVTRARRTKRTLVPTHVEGCNSSFFYNLARLRRWSGIRANVEMIFLVDEMFRQRGKTVRLTFGKPVPASEIPTGVDTWSYARRLKNHVYRLGENPDALFVPPPHAL